MPCPDENTLMMYFHRRLPPDEFRTVEEHIDMCQACRGIVAELARNASGAEHTVTPVLAELLSDGEPLSSDMLSRGMLVDRFVILELLGAGGMGVVFAAYDPKLERKIALKFLRVSYQREVQQLQTARLLREAKVMARLSHPNVVAIYELGLWNNQVFVAMEFVQGRTIKEWILAEQPGWKKILEVFVQAGHGLEAVHAAGLVHRDFKPDNVMISQDGRVLVTDFGLARDAIASAEEGEAIASPMEAARLMSSVATASSSEPLTRTGEFLGTPAYMAPEQFLHQPVDSQTDQFAYCVTLYEALYGQRPFSGDTIRDVSQQILEGEVRAPPSKSKVPLWIFRILQRGLVKDAQKRFSSMKELLRELSKDPMRMRQRVWAVGGLCLLLGLASFVTYWLLRPDRRMCETQEESQGIWNPQRAAQVKAAFLETQLPYAQAAWGQVDQRLNQLLQSWERMRRDTCEATWIRHEQSEQLLDLRMQCLNRRKDELRALIDLFIRADRDILGKSVEAVSSLSELNSCSNVTELLAPIELPSDPLTKAKVQYIYERLADVKALYASGKFKKGRELAQDLAKNFPSLAYAPCEAETLYWFGVFQYRTGEPRLSEQTLLLAAKVAVAGRHGEYAVRSWSMLSAVVGYDLARSLEGTRWAELALAWIESMGGNPVLEADTRKNLAKIFHSEGKYDNALTEVKRAYQLLTSALGPNHLETIQTESGIGAELIGIGNFDEALSTLRHALSVMEKEFGTDHPLYANMLQNLGIVLSEQGKFEESLGLFQQSLDIYRNSMEPQSIVISNLLNNIGLELVRLNRLTEAEKYLQDALAIREMIGGPESPFVGTSHLNLGDLFLKQDRIEEALAEEQKANLIFNKLYPNGHPRLASSYVALGDVYQKLGKYRMALSFYQKGQEMVTKLLGPKHPWLVDGLMGFGDVFLQMGQFSKAASHFEKILSQWKQKEVSPETYAKALSGLAQSLWRDPQSRDKCRQLILDAHKILLDRGKIDQKQRLDLERWMKSHGVPVPIFPKNPEAPGNPNETKL